MAERRDPTREADRLDVPGARRTVRLPHWDADAFGNFAERFARFMGTGQFLVYMTVFVALWLFWNSAWFIPKAWQFDPRTLNYTLLTLILSLQASYAAPLILLAQNRQEARDKMGLDEDRRVAAQTRADMDYLAREIAGLRASVGDLATRDYIRSELRDLLAELDRADERPADH